MAAASAVLPDSERGSWGRLVVVLLAAVAPAVPAAMTRQWAPFFVTALAVSAVGAIHGWVHHKTFYWRDAGLVAALSAVAALSQPIFGVLTLFGGLCAASLLRARGIAMPWLSWGSRRWPFGVLIGLSVGAVLGGLNAALALAATDERKAGGDLNGLLDALRAGVSEELGMRLCLLALCVFVLGKLPSTRGESRLTYLVLIVPHAAIHFVEEPSQMVGGTIFLGLVFGLPLSVLLRRFGLLSAAVAHTLIDVIRVIVIGS